MIARGKTPPERHRHTRQFTTTAAAVRARIDAGGERLWQLQDFGGLPIAAVAQTLSRLARESLIQRLSKGVYYRGRSTPFGHSQPNPAAIQQLARRHANLFPSGVAAANLLGFTTQAAGRPAVATPSGSLPRKLIGPDTVVHTRRPSAWSALIEHDAALLEFLRDRGNASELPPDATVAKLLAMLAEGDAFDRLLAVAPTEPPRVRAILGAVGQQLGRPPRALATLRKTLNPLTRFDFGRLAALTHAPAWQAKPRRREGGPA